MQDVQVSSLRPLISQLKHVVTEERLLNGEIPRLCIGRVVISGDRKSVLDRLRGQSAEATFKSQNITRTGGLVEGSYKRLLQCQTVAKRVVDAARVVDSVTSANDDLLAFDRAPGETEPRREEQGPVFNQPLRPGTWRPGARAARSYHGHGSAIRRQVQVCQAVVLLGHGPKVLPPQACRDGEVGAPAPVVGNVGVGRCLPVVETVVAVQVLVD